MLPLEFSIDIETVGDLWPMGRAPRLIPVDPSKFARVFEPASLDANRKSLQQLEKRLPREVYWRIQRSLGFLLRYGYHLFPGFACIYGELVNDEWLAMVDYHKDFHRDHIIHQTQEALVVKRLFEEVQLSCTTHPLARQCRQAGWTQIGPSRRTVSLRELAAFVLATGDMRTRYVYEYAAALGVPVALLEPETEACYRFWYQVVYDAAITAALYHDIGYPLQFLSNVASDINRGRFTDLLQGIDLGRVNAAFDDPLCLMPFRGHRSARQVGLSNAIREDIDKAIVTALRGSHGLPGALTFLKLNHEVMDIRDGRRHAIGRLTLELAALAIAMHDAQGVYLGRKRSDERLRWTGRPMTPDRPRMRVAFRKDPVSYVMALADQVQGYGRFNAVFGRAHPAIAGAPDRTVTFDIDVCIAACRVAYRDDGSWLTIASLFDSGHIQDCARQHVRFDPDTRADFFDPQVGYLDSSGLFEQITVEAEVTP